MNKEHIIATLSQLKFANGYPLIKCISSFVIRNAHIGFSIEVGQNDVKEALSLKEQAIDLLKSIFKVDVTIVITNSANRDKELLKKNVEDKAFNNLSYKEKFKISNIKKIICVASGKGGVGKSTISALLAQNLQANGSKVGLVDADIYGPSIPKIFGIENQKPFIKDGKFIPIEVNNIKIISMGLLVEPSNSLPWRGPIITKAIQQLLKATLWGELDFLIIDTPPGTGDIHLSLLENYHIDGVIIVTTPQALSVADAAKAIDMYQKFKINLLGIVENMSYVINSANNEKVIIFGEGGGGALSRQFDIPLLAKLPLSPELSRACDVGASLIDKVETQAIINYIIDKI